jgi:4-hydroxybenzoyl-CoA reductase subunit beta
MILPKFEYRKVETVAGALSLYSDYDGKASYLAGGTDLIPLVKSRLAMPAVIIDLKGVKELRTIQRRSGWLSVGANVTLFELKQDVLVKDYFPALYQSLEATSCETLQMRGTIGGNILQDTRCIMYNKSLEWRTASGFCYKMGGKACNAVPGSRICFANYCSDNALSLISLSAQATLTGPGGDRIVEVEKIFTKDGKRPLAIEPGEILLDILIPMEKTKGAYEKLRVRDSMDYPLVGVAVSVKGAAGRACVGAVGPAPLVYDWKGTTEEAVKEVAQKAYTDAKTVANAVLSPAYRKKMVGVLVKRAANNALQEGK